MAGVVTTAAWHPAPIGWVTDPLDLLRNKTSLLPNKHKTPNENSICIARLIIIAWLVIALFRPSPATIIGGAAVFGAFWLYEYFHRNDDTKGGGSPMNAASPYVLAPKKGGLAVDPAKMPGTKAFVSGQVGAALSPLLGTYQDPKTGLNPIWRYAPQDALPLALDHHPRRIVAGQPYGSTPEATTFLASMFMDPNELINDRIFSLKVHDNEAEDRTRFIEGVNAGLCPTPKDKYGDNVRARLDAWYQGPVE